MLIMDDSTFDEGRSLRLVRPSLPRYPAPEVFVKANSSGHIFVYVTGCAHIGGFRLASGSTPS